MSEPTEHEDYSAYLRHEYRQEAIALYVEKLRHCLIEDNDLLGLANTFADITVLAINHHGVTFGYRFGYAEERHKESWEGGDTVSWATLYRHWVQVNGVNGWER